MKELSPDARSFLAQARAGLEPSIADKIRVRAAVTGGAGQAAVQSGQFAPWLKLVVVLAVVTTGVSVWLSSRAETSFATNAPMTELLPAVTESTSPTMTVTTLPTVTAATLPTVTAATLPTVTPTSSSPTGNAAVASSTRVSRHAASARTRAPTATAKLSTKPTSPQAGPATTVVPPRQRSSLSEEIALVAKARRLLRTQDYSGALAACVEHKRKFHHGQLAQEAASIHVRASCAINKSRNRTTTNNTTNTTTTTTTNNTTNNTTNTALAAFRARWPNSPHLARVRSACTTTGDSQ